MNKFHQVCTFALVMLVASVGFGAEKKTQVEVAKHLQDISVTVKAKGSEGSGVIKTRVVKNGDKEETVSFVWSAAHVISGLRKTRSVIDAKSGTPKTVIEFDDAQIVQEEFQNGRKIGESKMDARVLKYSDADNNEDLCILQIRKRNFAPKDVSAKFYLDGDLLPSVGENLLHCGSLLGQNSGANSITSGIVSANGRLYEGKTYTQTNVSGFPGSSGGGIFLRDDGRLIGLLTRGYQTTFLLHVPMTRIKSWAERNKLMFTIDDVTPVPFQEQLDRIPVEDSGTNFSSERLTPVVDAPSPPPMKDLKFLIKVD